MFYVLSFACAKESTKEKWRYVPNFSKGEAYRQAVQINTGIIFAPQH